MASACRTVTLEDVIITRELLSRRVHPVNARAEINAMHELAGLLSGGPSGVLKRLARLAVELCDAGTGGISMLETDPNGRVFFRWEALAGQLESHAGGATPREWSPCGECLRAGTAMLYSYPGRFFTYFEDAHANIVEGLVIPMYADGLSTGTIWIVSHDAEPKFDAEDVRVMTSLGSFVTAALRLSLQPQGMEREVVWSELVRRMANGDADALEALMDETRPLVFARALKVLSSRADAEETTSDVYSQVWRVAARYDVHRCNVSAWLLTIARNRAIDRLRARISQEQRTEQALCEMCASPSVQSSSAAYYGNRNDVRQALQAISAEQRRVIELAYFDGYSTAEIAVRLGHPQGTVKTHIRTGLIALRRLVAAAERHDPGLCRAQA